MYAGHFIISLCNYQTAEKSFLSISYNKLTIIATQNHPGNKLKFSQSNIRKNILQDCFLVVKMKTLFLISLILCRPIHLNYLTYMYMSQSPPHNFEVRLVDDSG